MNSLWHASKSSLEIGIRQTASALNVTLSHISDTLTDDKLSAMISDASPGFKMPLQCVKVVVWADCLLNLYGRQDCVGV
jgi:hypothetical protein